MACSLAWPANLESGDTRDRLANRTSIRLASGPAAWPWQSGRPDARAAISALLTSYLWRASQLVGPALGPPDWPMKRRNGDRQSAPR